VRRYSGIKIQTYHLALFPRFICDLACACPLFLAQETIYTTYVFAIAYDLGAATTTREMNDQNSFKILIKNSEQ